MELSEVEAQLADLQAHYQKASGQLSLLTQQKEKKEQALAQVRKDIDVWKQVQVLLTQASEYAREQLRARIEETVTAALLAVFGEGHAFRINMRSLGEQPAAEWQVVSKYGDSEVVASPEDAHGGGIVDVVSLALRLALMELSRPRPGGPVVLDEPGKMVSAEYLPNVAEFLKQYAAKTGRQVIMITHAEPLAEVADTSYRVVLRGGVSEVSKIR